MVQTARVFSSSVPTTIRIKRMRNPVRLPEVMGVKKKKKMFTCY